MKDLRDLVVLRDVYKVLLESGDLYESPYTAEVTEEGVQYMINNELMPLGYKYPWQELDSIDS